MRTESLPLSINPVETCGSDRKCGGEAGRACPVSTHRAVFLVAVVIHQMRLQVAQSQVFHRDVQRLLALVPSVGLAEALLVLFAALVFGGPWLTFSSSETGAALPRRIQLKCQTTRDPPPQKKKLSSHRGRTVF